MGTKKFIDSVKSFLVLKDFKNEDKKESLQKLLKTLKTRKASVMQAQEASPNKKEKKELKEDLEIITLHIKKGEKLLYTLTSKK